MTSYADQRAQITALALEKINLRPVYIDTETTGLNRTDEIVEISIVDYDGAELFSELIKPRQAIPREAERIHRISNRMVESAQPWPVVWPKVRSILYGRVIAAYNAPFDLKMMEQSHAAYRLSFRDKLNMLDVLQLFSTYRGEWDPMRRSYRYFKLEEAGRFFNIPLLNAHRSTADALLTRAVLHSIAGLPY